MIATEFIRKDSNLLAYVGEGQLCKRAEASGNLPVKAIRTQTFFNYGKHAAAGHQHPGSLDLPENLPEPSGGVPNLS